MEPTMSTWTDPDLTPDEQENLDAILTIDWDNWDMTFDQVQRYMEKRRGRSEVELTREGKIRCKCGTEAMLGPGTGPHAAKAECPVCKRKWWVDKEEFERSKREKEAKHERLEL